MEIYDISFKIIGLRPGEKLHEVLCPKDDSRNTIEFSSFYTIKPTINFGKKSFATLTSIKSMENGRFWQISANSQKIPDF